MCQRTMTVFYPVCCGFLERRSPKLCGEAPDFFAPAGSRACDQENIALREKKFANQPDWVAADTKRKCVKCDPAAEQGRAEFCCSEDRIRKQEGR